MTAAGWRLKYRRLQAPRADRTVLVDPPSSAVGDLVAGNLALRRSRRCEILGRDVAELSALARDEMLQAAQAHTGRYRDVDDSSAPGPLLVAGHQPSLFHPGVWAKNFALSEIARRHGGTAINLIVDNDTVADAAIRAPSGTISAPAFQSIPFDEPYADVPWEERPLVSPETFASFAERAAVVVRPFVAEPLLQTYWSLVRGRARQAASLGTVLAEARHELEGAWGLQTWEAPISRLTGGAAFGIFALHLLDRAASFREIYNATIDEYRAVHKLRSKNHPAPQLAAEDGWIETPFWLWRATAPRRRRGFVRRTRDELLLSDRGDIQIALPLPRDRTAETSVQALMSLSDRGVKLRPRALTTTLFARLLLADLFIHGIGGAKYDQVTDGLIARFFGVESPAYLTVSATLLLPIERPPRPPSAPRELDRQLRELMYHPETALGEDDLDAEARALIARKRRWIDTPATIENARARDHDIRQINAALQAHAAARRFSLEAARVAARSFEQAERVLSWREFPFCIYPEETLRKFLLEILPAAL